MADTSNFKNSQSKAPDSCSQTKQNLQDPQILQQPNDGQSVTNILPVFSSSSQACTTNPILTYQNPSFGSLYNSPAFNSSLTGYENNLQWLTDTRLPNQHNQLTGVTSDKNANNAAVHSLPPTTSHSCCVNRFSVNFLDSLGMNSPIPPDQVKSTNDASNFQNKSNLAMNMIDPMQSWLNFQIPPQISSSQQYCKYGERSITQNYNIPVSLPNQMNLPFWDQSDLKHNEICIQSPDACFENITADNSKHSIGTGTNLSCVKHVPFSSEIKEANLTHIDSSNLLKQQSAIPIPQISLTSKEWKTFQSMPSYKSNPNILNASGNELQENLLYPPYTMPPTKLYYSATDNFPPIITKSSSCTGYTQFKTVDNVNENIPSSQNHSSNMYIDPNTPKVYRQNSSQNVYVNSIQNVKNQTLDKPGRASSNSTMVVNQPSQPTKSSFDGLNSFLDCCHLKPSQMSTMIKQVEEPDKEFLNNGSNQESKVSKGVKNSVSHTADIDSCNQNTSTSRSFRISDAESSDSEESNIIVEESDDIGEIESEISIEEIRRSYQSNVVCESNVPLKCFICNATSSMQTPATQFSHFNKSFPLTTASNTPVWKKLEQIVPLDLQRCLRFYNSFMCRRCLNLIETVEVLEVKLKTAKKTLNDNLSKTLQQFLPEMSELIQNEVQDTDEVDKMLKENTVPLSKPDIIVPPVEKEDFQSGRTEDVEEDAKLVISDAEKENTSQFKCCYCSKVLASQVNLSLHLQQHTKEFNYYCERCGKGFPLKSSLEKHLNWHNGETRDTQVLCELCGEVFSSKDLFKSHFRKHHSGEFKFECETCKKGFTRKVSLDIHSCKHSGVRQFVCEYCGHTFVTESNLKNHIRVCTKDFPYKCNKCDKGFALESKLKKHLLQHEGMYKLTCSQCGKGFDKPSDLKYHSLSHSSEKLYKCNYCVKAFKTSGSLNYHVKTVHQQEKRFVCSICGRNFGQKTLLADHMNSHTNERPYKCSQCEKCFVHQATFITHLKTHSGKVKVKTCPECGKSIRTRMSVHMRVHSGEKPYKCSSCPLAFSVSATLKKHTLVKHGKT